jgi:hypothetical protein
VSFGLRCRSLEQHTVICEHTTYLLFAVHTLWPSPLFFSSGSSLFYCINGSHFSSECLSLICFKFSVEPVRSVVDTIAPIWTPLATGLPVLPHTHFWHTHFTEKWWTFVSCISCSKLPSFHTATSVQVSPACEQLVRIEVYCWCSLIFAGPI